MPDILMTRIDNRLVHGQVGVAWTTALQGVNLIVVADDLAAADPLQQSLMAATAKSSGCGIRFFTLDKTIAVIHKASASQHIFLVVRNPQSARKLVEGGVPIDKLCIGNMHVGPGKDRRCTCLYGREGQGRPSRHPCQGCGCLHPDRTRRPQAGL